MTLERHIQCTVGTQSINTLASEDRKGEPNEKARKKRGRSQLCLSCSVVRKKSGSLAQNHKSHVLCDLGKINVI